jgi:hypothetical protein
MRGIFPLETVNKVLRHTTHRWEVGRQKGGQTLPAKPAHKISAIIISTS